MESPVANQDVRGNTTLTLQADSSSQLYRGEPVVRSKGNPNVPDTSGPPWDEFSSLEPCDRQAKDAGLSLSGEPWL